MSNRIELSETERETLTVMEAIEKHLLSLGFNERSIGSLSVNEQGLLGNYKNKTILQTEIAFTEEFGEQIKPTYAAGEISNEEVEILIAGLVVDVHLAILYEWAKNRIVFHIGSKKGTKPTKDNVFGFRIGENFDTIAIAVLLFGQLRIDEHEILSAIKMLEPLSETVRKICITE